MIFEDPDDLDEETLANCGFSPYEIVSVIRALGRTPVVETGRASG